MPVLGAAGLSLSLASGATAATAQPAAEMTARNAPVTQEVTLAEEEIADVTLGTFHVFDKETPTAPQSSRRLAMGACGGGGCGCSGCAGCGGCWTGTYYTAPVFGGDGYAQPRPIRPAHKYAHPSKRPQGQ